MVDSPEPEWPILTERLVIRPVRASDAEGFLTWRSRPDVVRFMYQDPWTIEVAQAKLAEWAGAELATAPDARQFAIARRETPELLIGEAMLALRAGEGQGEIGWTMHPDAAGHGYATEYAREILALGFGRYGLHRIAARIDEENESSRRLAERLGMRLEARLVENDLRPADKKWSNETIYALLASEFAGFKAGR